MPGLPDTIAEAESLLSRGDAARAKALLQRPAAQHAKDPRLNALMSRALSLLEQHDAALFYAQRAREASPTDPLLIALHGRALGAAGKLAEAVPVLQEAIARAPNLAAAHLALATTFYKQHDYPAAIDACAAARAGRAQNPELDELCAGALLSCGEPEEAKAVLERALQVWPGHPRLLSHLCCVLNYVPGLDPREVHFRHQQYGALLDHDLPRLPPLPLPALRPHGPRTTLGFVSPDLHRHSITWFLEPLLANLDRERFRIACFHVGTATDEITERLRSLSDLWRHVPRLGPTDLAKAIRADGVDIAIDLAGHTDGHRLAALHMAPAPRQVTWLGYPNTTGVRVIDTRLVDSLTDPAGADALATEHLLRLDPCFLCYQPPPRADAPEPAHPAHGAGAPLTFGSFSAMGKINDHTARMWADVLARVPGSRLILKNSSLAHESLRRRVALRLARAGIPAHRLELRAWSESTRHHLAMYHEVHVALDTWPYGGTTTTCEALWMGVPVVTRDGPPGMHAARVGVSLLAAVGLADLVAHDAEAYAAAAAALAKDEARVRDLRSSLRPRLSASVLCDGPAFARRFEAALTGSRPRTSAGST